MNKIYKVVWSKVKHCYVVTSELAKRNTKGCGARSLRMAAVSVGVAASLLCSGAVLPIFGESVAEAAEVTVTDAGNPPSDIYHIQTSILGTYENIYVANNTLAQTGFSGNTMNVTGGTTTTFSFAGAGNAGVMLTEDKISGNTINFSGGEVENLFGALSVSSEKSVNGNTVNMTGGTVNNTVYGGIGTGDVKGNKVEISGGTINAGKAVYGGYSIYNSVGGTGEGEGNKVVISDDAQVNSTVVGGFSSTKEAIGNSVEISGGEATSTVYGGYSVKDAVTGNRVVITGGKAGVNAESASYIIGGYSASSGAATDNKVTISDGTAGESRNVYIYGGSSVSGAADTNEVNLNGGKIGKFSYVSYIYGGGGKTSASGNTVNITGGAFENGSLYGGYSSTGTADTNIISMTGGTLSYTSIHGGRGGASASGNEVTVSGGLAGYVYGGAATYNTGKMNQNKVTVTGEETVVSGVRGGQDGVENNDNTVLIEDGSTVKVDVYGGYSTGAGSAINNKVTVTDSTVNGNVFGGVSFRGAEAVTKNAVTINNSTIGKNVYGGRQYDNESGTAFSVTGNIVTINGGTFAADKQMYGGFTYSGTTTDNIINLTGTTTGLEGVEIYGGSQSANTGNELHVGGTKTYDTSGNFVTNSGDVWQGSSNNTVKKVANFEKIVLHSVKWDKDVAALEATTVENVKTLDITDLKFYTDAAGTTQKTSFEEGESMALLKSVESDLRSVKLDYKSGDTVETVAITTEGVTLGGGATDKTETDGVNGVKLTQSVTEKVKLATDSKAISYSCEVGDVKGVTFNASTPITFSTTEVARDLTGKTFATSNTINAEGLKFKETNEAIAVSDSMTLISNATGITTTVTNETGKTVAITNYEDNQKIKYNATASGTVTSDGSAVKYTVGSVTVSSIDLSGWTGTASDLTQSNTSGWTGAGVSVTGSFTAPDIAANSSRDIVITNKSGFFTVDAIDDSIKYAAVDFSDDEANGVTLAGSQSKGVQAASDGTNDGAKLVYAVGTKDVTGITLGTMTAGTPRTMEAGYDFTGVTTINAGNLQFDKPEDVKANMTLVANATNLLEGKTVTDADHTQDFTKTAANSVALTASLKGTVETVSGAVNYTYSGTELKTINLANWNGNEATFDATGWTLAKDNTNQVSATVETDGMDVSSMNPGDEKPVLTVTGVNLTGIKVNGEYEYKAGGESIAETSAHASGVTITAGTTTGGGVKVNETNTSQLIYQKDKKDVTGITLGSVAYTKGGKAREFDSTYDLTTATINAEAFSITNPTATMNAGDTMIVVDATQAIKGTGTATLKSFATKTMDPLDFSDAISGTVLTFAGKHTDTLEQNSEKTQIVYKVGDKNVETVTLNGSVTWNDSKAYYTNDAAKYKFNSATAVNVNVAELKVTGSTDKLLKADGSSSMTLLSATGMTAGTFTDQSEANKAASKVSVNYKDDKGVAFKAEAKGEVKAEAAAVKYSINEVKLTEVDLSAWTGSESSVPDTWTAEDGSVKVATGSFAEPDVAIGSARTILTAGSAFFADVNISGANKYDEANGKAFSETQNNVTVSGTQAKGVAASEDSKSLVYKVDIKKADTVSFGATNWQKGATLFDGSSATEYDYANVTAVDAGKFDVTYASPETVAAGESMTLLKANETLTAIINEEKAKAYSFSPVSGVTVDAAITGKLTNSNNNVVFTAAANQASKLTFGDVEWKDSGALMTRPSNITFASADVDTSKINFTNMIYLDADRQMTLVSDFGDKVGTITGSKYLVGTAFEGEGAASLSGSDLVFRTKTGAGVSEQTHKTVMATEVGVTMLNTGNDYIDKAMEGMGDLANVAPDGTTVGAAIGGGRNRYETGSHVNVNSWNAAVAVGAKRELKNGSLEYGVFGEYGKANFTLHSDAGKGDGDSHYAGGGLLAKWTNKHDVYTEASFRLGRLNESSNDIMRDGLGNKYGYDVHANYFGAHVGVGKIFRYKGGKSLDVYGKYFYTKRDGVEFDAVQHYKLDSVKSSILRIGARYGTTDKKWNWYGGLAYEYEFDGEATGTVKDTAIRAASIKGSSVRGEIGLRMNATDKNPWQTDISLYGYGGKHRGFGGNVNIAYTF